MCSLSYDVVVNSDIFVRDIPSRDEANEVASFWRNLLPSSEVIIYCKSVLYGLTKYYRVF